jgi:uncharacterized protein YjiS (DUF1127 family)
MTTTHSASKLVETAELRAYVASFFRRHWYAHQERRKRQRLRATLYGLADRDLKDIGVTRSEIEYIALNGTDTGVDPRRRP